VTFDPFGDFETEGYLRNFEKEKDIALRPRRYPWTGPHPDRAEN
jgi:hypothetical protein